MKRFTGFSELLLRSEPVRKMYLPHKSRVDANKPSWMINMLKLVEGTVKSEDRIHLRISLIIKTKFSGYL